MPLESFESELIRKYKTAVIDAIGKIKELSLSLLSRMIGPRKWSSINSVNYDGFFNADRHDSDGNTFNKQRKAATDALNSAITIFDKNKCVSFTDYIGEKSNDKRREFQCNHLIIHRGQGTCKSLTSNIERIFPLTKGHTGCDGHKFIFNCSGFKDVLYLPPKLFDGFFDDIFENIAKHSLCSNGQSKQHNIFIESKEMKVGEEGSLFFLIIKIYPLKPWAWDKYNHCPHPLKEGGKLSKLLFLCDYLIMAPRNSDYFIYPCYALGGSDQTKKNWIKLNSTSQDITLRINKKVSFQSVNEKIMLHNAEVTTSCENGALKPIFHIFVFDHQMDDAVGAQKSTTTTWGR